MPVEPESQKHLQASSGAACVMPSQHLPGSPLANYAHSCNRVRLACMIVLSNILEPKVGKKVPKHGLNGLI